LYMTLQTGGLLMASTDGLKRLMR